MQKTGQLPKILWGIEFFSASHSITRWIQMSRNFCFFTSKDLGCKGFYNPLGVMICWVALHKPKDYLVLPHRICFGGRFLYFPKNHRCAHLFLSKQIKKIILYNRNKNYKSWRFQHTIHSDIIVVKNKLPYIP